MFSKMPPAIYEVSTGGRARVRVDDRVLLGGWKCLLDDIEPSTCAVRVCRIDTHYYLQITAHTKDVNTKQTTLQMGRKWLLSRHMTSSEFIQTVFLALKTFGEHELRERFTYQGKRVFGPHISTEALASVCDQLYIRPKII